MDAETIRFIKQAAKLLLVRFHDVMNDEAKRIAYDIATSSNNVTTSKAISRRFTKATWDKAKTPIFTDKRYKSLDADAAIRQNTIDRQSPTKVFEGLIPGSEVAGSEARNHATLLSNVPLDQKGRPLAITYCEVPTDAWTTDVSNSPNRSGQYRWKTLIYSDFVKEGKKTAQTALLALHTVTHELLHQLTAPIFRALISGDDSFAKMIAIEGVTEHLTREVLGFNAIQPNQWEWCMNFKVLGYNDEVKFLKHFHYLFESKPPRDSGDGEAVNDAGSDDADGVDPMTSLLAAAYFSNDPMDVIAVTNQLKNISTFYTKRLNAGGFPIKIHDHDEPQPPMNIVGNNIWPNYLKQRTNYFKSIKRDVVS